MHKKFSHKLGLLVYETPPNTCFLFLVLLLLLLLFCLILCVCVCVCVPDCLKRYSFPQGSHCFGKALRTFLNSFPLFVISCHACHVVIAQWTTFSAFILWHAMCNFGDHRSLVLTHLCIKNVFILWQATRGLRNPNLQVAIIHAPASFGGIHRTQSDPVRSDFLSFAVLTIYHN